MTYRLLCQNGDSVAVPQLIFTQLARADENCVRVALYVLASGSTDPRDIAHALHLKSQRAAEDALKWWAGAGLLEAERGGAPLPAAPTPVLTQEEMNLAALRDPLVATLTSEAQRNLGRALGPKEAQRLVSLYVNEGIAPEVILLCCAHLAGGGQTGMAALERELARWRDAGVDSGEDAERYLQLLGLRKQREQAAAALLGLAPDDLRLADKRMIQRWYEEYGFDDAMVREAAAHAEDKKEIRYLNGILKSWHGRGYRTPQDVRGGGALAAANLRVDRKSPSGNNFLQHGARRPLRITRED